MALKNTRLHILHNGNALAAKARTGVSLHCHTEYSKEMLDFVPHYAEKLPIIAQFWRRESKKYVEREGKAIDFDSAYWSPPLPPEEVYAIEKRQINDAGMDALVSLTDHDSIDANVAVNENAEAAPISMEWTVPFDFGFFHVGVHNLPKESAVELTKTLLDYTFEKENHTDEKLAEMFAMLDELPGVLVVLNHPLWDIEMAGKEPHLELLKDFIRIHGKWIHAFEVNGFRSWSENKAVIELAGSIGMPVVTGGDRHGCKPNTVINLTNATTFEEFAEEVRVDKRTEVVLMPAYEQPLQSRQLESFAEILRHYPVFRDGRRKWFDRVYVDIGDGHGVRQLSDHWDRGGPTWLRAAIWTLGVLGSPKARPVFRAFRKKADRVPKAAAEANFEIIEMEGPARGISSESPA